MAAPDGPRLALPQPTAWPSWAPRDALGSWPSCWLVRSRQEPARLYVWGSQVGAAIVAAAHLRPGVHPELDAAASVLLATGCLAAVPPPRNDRRRFRRR